MSGTSTKKYVIHYHPDMIDDERGSYGVHVRNGQIVGNYPTLERAEQAMMRFVATDKRRQAQRKAQSIVRVMK